jgi:hypothetical protein
MLFGAAPYCPCGRSKNPTPMIRNRNVSVVHVFSQFSNAWRARA